MVPTGFTGRKGKTLPPLGNVFPFPCTSAHKTLSCLCRPSTTDRPGLSLETASSPRKRQPLWSDRGSSQSQNAGRGLLRTLGSGEPAPRCWTHLHAGLLDCLHQKHLVGGPLLVVNAVLHHRGRPGGGVVGRWDFHSR